MCILNIGLCGLLYWLLADFINIVKDPCSDDRDEEDPKLYRSAETGRGPLADNWLETIESDSVMCAYKVLNACGH